MELPGERPLEDDANYEQRFYCESADGAHHDRLHYFPEMEGAIERAIQCSFDDDVWAVCQVGKQYDEENGRDDRIIALVYHQRIYRRHVGTHSVAAILF